MKIGFTERGDGGRDLSWTIPCVEHAIDGIVVITKSITKSCGESILSAQADGIPVTLHATCTGWGGTLMEPHAFTAENQLGAVRHLIDSGFPAARCVIRIDPIIPTEEGLRRAEDVFETAKRLNVSASPIRFRISVLDEYQHSKARMRARGLAPAYPDSQFYASQDQFKAVAELLRKAHRKYGIESFDTCAEPQLSPFDSDHMFRDVGCISKEDLRRMNLPVPELTTTNGQNRRGCKCLAVKKELLSHKHPCPNQCAYCYWKD